MKLQDELDNIVNKLQLIKDKIPPYAEQLKANNNYKNFENRLAWDCLRAVCKIEEICSWYEKYNANDSHIETLAKNALKTVYAIN